MRLWCSDMQKHVTPDDTRAWFAEHMKHRPDYGIGKAVVDLMLQPRSPFNPKERRRFRRAFLYAVAWLGAASSVFAYFNFAR
jgi:hypothetical protein